MNWRLLQDEPGSPHSHSRVQEDSAGDVAQSPSTREWEHVAAQAAPPAVATDGLARLYCCRLREAHLWLQRLLQRQLLPKDHVSQALRSDGVLADVVRSTTALDARARVLMLCAMQSASGIGGQCPQDAGRCRGRRAVSARV